MTEKTETKPAGVVVLGMNMPRACRNAECALALSLYECDELFCMAANRYVTPGDVPADCPCRALPAGCGDLVSRDWLLAEYDRQHKGPPGGARRIMEDAPAVIPARSEDI